MNTETISALANLITAAAGLIGILSTLIISTRFARRQERKNHLTELYARLFTVWWQAYENRTTERIIAFISVAETVRLFCSPESDKLIQEMEQTIIEHDARNENYGKIMYSLREYAKRDIHQSEHQRIFRNFAYRMKNAFRSARTH